MEMKSNNTAIRDRLVGYGRTTFSAAKEPIAFTQDNDADRLLNDLDHMPHIFVIACVMDRQIKAEKAWLIPYKIGRLIGGHDLLRFAGLSEPQVHQHMTEPEILHRYAEMMSRYFYLAVHRIQGEYGGDAALIWSNKPSSAEVVYRFLQFDGVGPKIATMATNILARELKIPMSDYYSIDISADVQVKRVFARLGLCSVGPSEEQVVYKARALYPEFPGLMDLPTWEIGRRWCRPSNPLCGECYMRDICPSAS